MSKKEALFIVPPDGFSIFRVYGRRGIVVSDKDGRSSPYSATFAKKWYNEYKEMIKVYHKNSTSYFLETARKIKIEVQNVPRKL